MGIALHKCFLKVSFQLFTQVPKQFTRVPKQYLGFGTKARSFRCGVFVSISPVKKVKLIYFLFQHKNYVLFFF